MFNIFSLIQFSLYEMFLYRFSSFDKWSAFKKNNMEHFDIEIQETKKIT